MARSQSDSSRWAKQAAEQLATGRSRQVSWSRWIGTAVLLGLALMFILPLHRDYRAFLGVANAMELVRAQQEAIRAVWKDKGDLEGVTSESLGLSRAPSGRFGSAVDVDDGVIQVLMGSKTNPKIRGAVVTLLPAVRENGTLIWVCGGQTDLAERYRRVVCHVK